MHPFPPDSPHASARSIRYEIVGPTPAEGYAERFTVALAADGRVRVDHEHGPIRQSWSARAEDVVWTRLVDALRDGVPADSSHQRVLQVFGDTPEPTEAAPSATAAALLDSLIAQISGLTSAPAGNTLPPLTHRADGDGRVLPRQEGAAVFGTVGGQPAFALARPGGGFGVFSVDPLKTLAETAESGQPIRALALGSDGTRDLLVTGGDDHTVWAWDLTGDDGLRHARGGHGGPVRAVTTRTDPGGDALVWSGGADGNVWGWDGRDGAEVGALTGHEGTVNALATAQVGGVGLLVSGADDGTVRVWNTDTGESLRTFTPGTAWVNAVAITGAPGGGLIAAAGSDHVVRVWDLAKGGAAQELRGHSAAVTGLAFLDLDGRAVLASCAYDGTIRTWDTAAGEALAAWPAQDVWPAALAAAPAEGGAVLVSGGETGTVRVWDAQGTPLRALPTDAGPVQALATADLDGGTTVAAGFLDGSLGLWDAATGTVRHTLAPDDGPVTSVAFGPAGTVVCGTARGTVRIHSTADGALQLVPTPHVDRILALAFLPGAAGVVASAGADRTVRTWGAATGRPLLRLRGHQAEVTRLAAGKAGDVTVLASADEDGTILVWDADSGRRLLDLRAAGPVSALAFGAGVLAAAEAHGSLRVWDPVSGTELAAVPTGDTAVVTVTLGTLEGTPTVLAGTQDGKVRAWRLPDGAEAGEISVNQPPLALSFTEPGTLRVAGAGGLTTLDDLTS